MDKQFWDQRWKDQETGWDIGYVSPPLKAYFDTLEDKNLRILIPGSGNSYEAEYLHSKGFANVFVIDISAFAVDSFKKRCPDFPPDHVLLGDFFELNESFDLIVEQTFFCAIHPTMRDRYCEQMSKLLRSNGKLIGLLFGFPLESGPPFGGSKTEYLERFQRFFKQVKIERAKNSIKPREGQEFWIEISA